MNRFAAHDTRHIFLTVNNDTLCCKRLRIKTTQWMKPNKPIVINVRDDKADLVHMSCYQYPLLLTTFLYCNERAHCINKPLINEIRDLFLDDIPDPAFKSRSTRRFRNFFQQLKINHRLKLCLK